MDYKKLRELLKTIKIEDIYTSIIADLKHKGEPDCNGAVFDLTTTHFDENEALKRLDYIEDEVRKLLEKYGYSYNIYFTYSNPTIREGVTRYHRKIIIVAPEVEEEKPKTYKDEYGTHPINDFGEIQYDLFLDEN